MRKRRESGFAMLLVMAMAGAVAIMLYRETPRLVFESQRIKERDLVMRGEQYRRAIQLYARKMKRYPQSIDDLVKSTDTRFLRRRYKDPMTGKAEWRLVHVDAAGFYTDSVIHKPKEQKEKKSENTFITERGAIGSTGPAPGQIPGQQGPAFRGASDRPAATAGQYQGPPGGEPFQEGGPPPPPGGDMNPGAQVPLGPGAFPAQPGYPAVPGAQQRPQYPYQQQPYPYPPQAGQPNPYPNQPGYPQGAAPYAMPAQPGQQPGQQPYQGSTFGSGYSQPSQPAPGSPYPYPFAQPGQYPPGTQPGQSYPPYAPQQQYPGAQPGPYAAPGLPRQYPQRGVPGLPGPYGVPGMGPPYRGYPQGPQGPMTPPMDPSGQRPGMPPQSPPGPGVPFTSPQPGTPMGPGMPGGPGQQGNQALQMIQGLLTTPRPGGLQGTPAAGGGGGAVMGPGIAGVATTRESEGIMVYGDKTKYNEWEFLYDPAKEQAAIAAGAAMEAGMGGEQNPLGAQGGQPSAFGNQQQTPMFGGEQQQSPGFGGQQQRPPIFGGGSFGSQPTPPSQRPMR